MTKAERLERDINKLAEMKAHEDELRSLGHRYIAGIDEVGRGPLAGPVYAACVVLPDDWDIPGVNDSKKLSAKKREELSAIIREKAVAYGIGIADNNEIDEINILEATKNAMKRAVAACNEALAAESDVLNASERGSGVLNAAEVGSVVLNASEPGSSGAEENSEYIPHIDMLLIDAVKLDTGIPSESIIKGDEKSLSIAAASIVAKVARDNYMTGMDEVYPGYDFAGNKGYGTAKHYEGLRSKGYTPIHRRSFLKKFEEEQNSGRVAWGGSAATSGPASANTASGTERENTAEDPQAGDRGNKMAKKKVYAVKKGRTPGIYMTWDDCKAQVDGFGGAEYKSFADPADAIAYLGLAADEVAAYSGLAGDAAYLNSAGVQDASDEKFPEGVRAYVDGSYDAATGRFSCGVVMIRTDAEGNVKTRELSQAFDDAEAAKQRNVAGEIMGAKTAIDFCLRQGIPEVEIYHDYEGVGKWADGLWKANNQLTQGYRGYVAKARERMKITFVKVKAHAGNKYNELADKLAKEALGI